MTRRLTRSQARAPLDPIRRVLQAARQGYMDSARGYAVLQHRHGECTRVDQYIEGIERLNARMTPNVEIHALGRVRRRLAAGVLVTQSDIDGAMRELRAIEDAMIKLPVETVRDAILAEQIAIELGVQHIVSHSA